MDGKAVKTSRLHLGPVLARIRAAAFKELGDGLEADEMEDMGLFEERQVVGRDCRMSWR